MTSVGPFSAEKACRKCQNCWLFVCFVMSQANAQRTFSRAHADTSCTAPDKSSSRQRVLGAIYKINLAVINIWHFS